MSVRKCPSRRPEMKTGGFLDEFITTRKPLITA